MPHDEIIARLRTEIDTLRDPLSGCLRVGAGQERLQTNDSLALAWETLPREPEKVQAVLRTLMGHQGQVHDPLNGEAPGMMPSSCLPQLTPWSPWTISDFGAAETTPLFVIVASSAIACSKKPRDLSGDLWPALRRACGWIEEGLRTAPSGLLAEPMIPKLTPADRPHRQISPSVGRTAPGAAIKVQGYACAALRQAAAVAEELSEDAAARVWNGLADDLAKNVLRRFWINREGYFASAVSGRKVERAVGSEPGHLLFTDILDRKRADQVVRRIFRPDMFTPYGIRSLSSVAPDFDAFSRRRGSVCPLDNWIISEGLRVTGRRRELSLVRDALLRAYRELGRLPEYYAVSSAGVLGEITGARYPHGCASGALLNLLATSSGRR